MPSELTISRIKATIKMRAAYMAIEFDDADIVDCHEPGFGTLVWLNRYKVMEYPDGYDEPGEWQYWPNVWLEYQSVYNEIVLPMNEFPALKTGYRLCVRYPMLICRINESENEQ